MQAASPGPSRTPRRISGSHQRPVKGKDGGGGDSAALAATTEAAARRFAATSCAWPAEEQLRRAAEPRSLSPYAAPSQENINEHGTGLAFAAAILLAQHVRTRVAVAEA
jgi:hypothetical protein